MAAAAIVIVLVIALVISWSSASTTASPTTPAKAVAVLSAIPASVLGQAAATNHTVSAPMSITAPALTAAGKPLVLYIGAEYCPFCASQRWAVVTALAKFGQWSNLGATHSGSEDVYPNTTTFSFAGATYSSPYLSFQGVELQSNVRQGSTYATLQTMTPAQQRLLQTYDAPPYVSSNGSIPWVDYGGRYVSTGSSYDPGLLAGKSMGQIASDAANTNTAIGQAITGSAGAIVARLCDLTGGQPGSVCNP